MNASRLTLLSDTSSAQFRLLLQQLEKLRLPCDSRDSSVHPSYSSVVLPYPLVCQYRYRDACIEYERQFQDEITKLIMAHTSATECARLTAILSIHSLWPPLHSRAEQMRTSRTFFRHSRRRRNRLYMLMNTKVL